MKIPPVLADFISQFLLNLRLQDEILRQSRQESDAVAHSAQPAHPHEPGSAAKRVQHFCVFLVDQARMLSKPVGIDLALRANGDLEVILCELSCCPFVARVVPDDRRTDEHQVGDGGASLHDEVHEAEGLLQEVGELPVHLTVGAEEAGDDAFRPVLVAEDMVVDLNVLA